MNTSAYIKDPIFNEFNLSNQKWVVKLINTFEFKRLENIKQLGLAYKVFPSATNTRYLHSLGVFQVAQKFLHKLKKKYPDIVTPEKIKLISAAALLHDVGHGPFSHAFEAVSNTCHEELTWRIITDPSSEINKILIEEEINPSDLKSIYEGKFKEKWVNKLISSNLDVDRIDYMLRDAYFLGTKYSTIDIDFLVERTFIINGDLTFSLKTKNVIESFLLGRYYMHDDIYESKYVYTYEWALLNIFVRLKELKPEFEKTKDQIYFYDQFSWIVFSKKPSLENYIHTSDDSLLAFIKSLKAISDEILNSFVKYFLSQDDSIEVQHFEMKEFLKLVDKVNKNPIKSNYLFWKRNKDHKVFYSLDKDDLIVLYDERKKKTLPFPYKSLSTYYNPERNEELENEKSLVLTNKKLLNIKNKEFII